MTLTSRNRLLHVIALIASAFASVGACDEQDARTLLVVDGAAVPVTLDELKPDWNMAVRVAGERKEVARSDYVLWGDYSDQDRSSQVLLTDGTVLVGDIARIEAESVSIASKLWGELHIDRRLVQAGLMLPAADPLERDSQRQLLQESESADRVLLLNGDAIAGRLLPTTERDGGGLFGLVSIRVELPSSGSSTLVRLEEVRAITFQAATARAAQAECLLGFRDGSLVAAAKLTRAEPDLARITTVAGALLKLRNDAFQQNLTFIQPHNERVNFLSDLPAVGYKSLPFLTMDWPLGVATNTLGGRLRAGGNVIFKGLGMHSASRVAYDLDRKYRRFEAELALDDHARRQGSVVYRALVERDNGMGQPTWELVFTSPIIRGGDTPLPIALDVTGATRLALVVEMADRTDTRDYANWLNARLLR